MITRPPSSPLFPYTTLFRSGDLGQASEFLGSVDGLMMGRAAYQEPWRLLAVDPQLFGVPAPYDSAHAAARALMPYIERELAAGTRLYAIVRHVLGLFHAVPGARAYRRLLATEAPKSGAGCEVFARALDLVPEAAVPTANCTSTQSAAA